LRIRSLDGFGLEEPLELIRKTELLARLLAIAILAGLLGTGSVANATLSASDLARVDAAPEFDASLPLALPLQDEQGEARPLQQWLGNAPSVWILADFTCETLCGPIVSIVSDALTHSGLRPGADFRLVVIGFDAKDSAADALAMKRAQIGESNSLSSHAYFLRGSTAVMAELAQAFGFRAIYDREHDQFAHPAAAFIVTATGHVARALSSLGLDPGDLRLALVDAGRGAVGSWTDHVRLMCYGFDPAKGVYTAAIGRILASAGALTIIGLVLLILLLFRRQHAVPGK
jgi:protein SCO1/2